MLIVSSLLRLLPPLIFVEISVFGLLRKCKLLLQKCKCSLWVIYLCKHLGMARQSSVLKCIQNFLDSSEIKHRDTRKCVCEYNPAVNLSFLQPNNTNAFQRVILKEGWKTKWNNLHHPLVLVKPTVNAVTYCRVQTWTYKIYKCEHAWFKLTKYWNLILL